MKQNYLRNKIFIEKSLELTKILLLIRWLIVLTVFLCWWYTNNNSIGIALVLVLSSTTLIRMQFTNSLFLILIEEIVCLISIHYWPMSVFALILPVFEGGVLGAPLVFVSALFIIFLRAANLELYAILIFNLMAYAMGYIIKAWQIREKVYLSAADSERKQRYEVELLKNELLTANNDVAKLVETSERNRIAQQLHDNVGHDIAGALIALQTYIKLEKNKDERAEEVLKSVLKRIESSSVKLRETVYKLRPNIEGGALRLQKLCEEFTFCPIKYRFAGDANRVPASVWIILEPCLKEAMTNIIKYSKATEVDVKFDINQYMIRMYIKDNGKGAEVINSGMGLFGIKERIRGAGGTVSIDGVNGFMLMCILPIDGC
jgi:signal transduction histidine kinase